jgi:hypothetical protein
MRGEEFLVGVIVSYVELKRGEVDAFLAELSLWTRKSGRPFAGCRFAELFVTGGC